MSAPVRFAVRVTTLALVASLAVGTIAGCSAVADDRPLVVVTTNILGDVVENVVGDEAEVMVLMRPGADPHSFEISAKDSARILGADLLVSNGLGLEEGLRQHLEAAAAEGVATLEAGDVIDVLPYAAGDAEGAPDPHFWTDPARVIDVAAAVADAVADDEALAAAAADAFGSASAAADASAALVEVASFCAAA